ncbi:MAG TPA: TldD/PmbA family protein [Gemmatimonadales bacterium]|nr:TldD/PmbA family protein [Gemmatimonadales bacterium]
MILDERQARAILEKALRLSKADECTVRLNGRTGGNIRYARNTVTTAGAQQNMSLSVASSFGKRTGSASTNEFDDASIERAIRRSEELARLAPENPEHMEVLGPQTYTPTPAYFESTAAITPDYRADVAAAGIVPARGKDCTAAGFLNDGAGFTSMLNSKGLFAYHRSSDVDFSLTVRTTDGSGSGYVTRDANDVRKFDAKTASAIALEKAVASRNPRAIEPGKYTVILEPEASVELIQNMMGFDARSAEEGRSWLAAPGGTTRLGQKLMDERVTIYSDPSNPEVPASPWSGDGQARRRTMWIEKGVVKNLAYSRYWAQKQGKEPLPGPANIIMEGGNESLEELIRGTRRGILLTRTWYIRTVDPQTLLYTGLTRDGTFYIEDGQIRYAVKNFRFNESPVIMLNNLDALGRPERIRGNLIPPMRVRDFTFTSLSDAI